MNDDTLIAFLAKETAEEHAPLDEVEDTEPAEAPAPTETPDADIPF